MTRRKLKLWEALALSLGLMGPTLAMSGNGQGIIGTVGKAVPLVFLLGFFGVALVAHGFIRLTQRYNHAGSAYALVGATLGPRPGFVAGFALVGTYLFFTICTASIFGAFVNALLGVGSGDNPPAIGFGISALVCLALNAYLSTRDTTTVSRLLLLIEGLGIAGMIVLVLAIFGQGGADATGIDVSTLSPSGVSLSAVIAAVVAAFLSWAGFEGCAALGEETDDPRRNIPRALFGSVLLTGVLFVVVMFAQTIGFGTDKAGLEAFQTSGNTLGDLGDSYVGQWFGVLLLVTAVMSAFASNLSSVAAAGRLVMALARHGFGPAKLAQVDARHHSPRFAILAVAAVSVVVNLISWLSGWPTMGTGDAAIDSYFFFAVVGATCLLFVYLLVEVAVFAAWRRGLVTLNPVELVIPTLGGLFILLVIWFGVKDATGLSPAFVALAWVALGLIIAVAASKLAARIGASLRDELDAVDEGHPPLEEPLSITR
ncbi:Amino acid permease [Janibacter sp. HTCC2649]|uniref:APC family permease n=1 Tax=Janibacter sp. HTCC2649 TaxID=313589 RepID=UPI000066EA0B|nr:APC family permease [Janibacter sp. HTCC2649]EAP99484.1 Amino acid permease [Janibacter sp. HTCC2649]